jgi:hypothetical protein
MQLHFTTNCSHGIVLSPWLPSIHDYHSMYSYPPRAPFNYVAKDVLHPAEQASCANVEYVRIPYNVQGDPNTVGVHAVQGKQGIVLSYTFASSN